MGTYIAIEVSDRSREHLHNWVTSNDVPSPTIPTDYHSTAVYSPTDVHGEHHISLPVVGRIVRWEVFESKTTGNSVLVGIIDCPELVDYHNHLVNFCGATHEFPGYNPHITVSTDFSDDLPNTVPNFDIVFDKLINRELRY